MTDQTNDQVVQETEQATEQATEQQPVILTFQMSLDNINGLLGFLSNASGVVNLLSAFGSGNVNNPLPLWSQIIRSQAVAQLQQMQAAADEAQQSEESAPTVQ